MQPCRLVTLLTDFGLSDGYVGALRGAVLSAAAEVSCVDICHDIPRHDIIRAAFVLRYVYSSFPVGTVHCVVVDPGVGSARAAIVVETNHGLFVGPDNGVLWPAVQAAGGGSVYQLPVPINASTTFHGRDVFAPAAARLAAGSLQLTALDPFEQPETLVFDRPVRLSPTQYEGAVLYVDQFGNLVTNIDLTGPLGGLTDEQFELRIGASTTNKLYDNYAAAAPDQLFCIWGSGGFLELSLNQGSAAAAVGWEWKQSCPTITIDILS